MKRGRVFALCGIVVGAILLALGLESIGYLSGVGQFEDYLLDLRQLNTMESFQPERADREGEITLILFDEETITDPELGWPYLSPFPRDHLAQLVDELSAAGAKTIGMDVYLDLLFPRLGGDDALAEAIERAGNVILVTPVVQTDSGPVSAPPHPKFGDVAAGIGTAEFPAAFETFRDGTLAVRSGDGIAPSFALALYAHSRDLDADSLVAAAWQRGSFDLPGLPPEAARIDPAWLDGSADDDDVVASFRIRYSGPPSRPDVDANPGTYPAVASGFVPFATLFTPELFQDKIVILGTGFHDSDRFRTPYFEFAPLPSEENPDPDTYGWMYGVEVHAHALQNLLDGSYQRRLGAIPKGLLMLLAAVLPATVAFRSGAAWGGAALAGTLLAVFTYAWWAWEGFIYVPGASELLPIGEPFLWIPVTVMALSGAFGYVGAVAYVSIIEGREKRYIKGAFSMYLSPELVNEIADDPSMLELGGAKRDLTFLFSDLAGFASISEDMDAQELIALLNAYLTEMTQIVKDERGYLDKYIGDAIMAFWNAPTPVEDHHDRALNTAIQMQRRMNELNHEWTRLKPEQEPLKVRIGIHSGEVVVGNVGATDQLNYSVIGDNVNLAARLEPANKEYDTLTMISETTLKAAKKRYQVRWLDYITVPGKDEPVRVYELIEEDGVPIPIELTRALERYREGIDAYRARDWAGAKERFEAALAERPEDGPSATYVKRCAAFIVDPPPEDWDFVVRRTKK